MVELHVQSRWYQRSVFTWRFIPGLLEYRKGNGIRYGSGLRERLIGFWIAATYVVPIGDEVRGSGTPPEEATSASKLLISEEHLQITNCKRYGAFYSTAHHEALQCLHGRMGPYNNSYC